MKKFRSPSTADDHLTRPSFSGESRLDRGRLQLTYQDAHRSLPFYQNDVRTVDVADLGTIVSVTLVLTVDIGSTTFSLLVPRVVLPGGQPSAFVHTDGVTTIHRAFVGAIGHPQTDSYTVTRLDGTASSGILPD
jgi:hypothetical protein